MNTIIKRVCILLCLSMLFSVTVYATAVEPRFAYINTINSEIAINEQTGKVSCKADLYANGSLTIKVMCRLQRVTINGLVTEKTWNRSNIGILRFCETGEVESGYKYRFYISGEIIDSNGAVIETFSKSCYCDYY